MHTQMFVQQDEVNPLNALSPYEGVSKSYKFYSTREIVDNLRNLGWSPAQVIKTKTRSIERRPYAKHMVRLRNSRYDNVKIGSAIPELVLVNAHDATSSLKLMAGIFRLICSNGLIRQTQDMGQDYIPHTKLDMQDVLKRVNTFGDYLDDTMTLTEKWNKYFLAPEQTQKFLEAAYAIRYPNADAPTVEGLEAINRYRRPEDTGTSLWITLNRVQENLMQGGFTTGISPRRARAIKSVDRNYLVNTKLWGLAESIYKAD
jgi:hypothetical protein